MNNQVKLIDQTKLLDWIEGNWEMERTAGTRESSVRAEMWHEFYHKVVSGDFAPDTPPVPTIKPGDKHRCPICNIASAQQEWDESTNKAYNGDAATIHDCKILNALALFVCPACGEETELHQLEVVE